MSMTINDDFCKVLMTYLDFRRCNILVTTNSSEKMFSYMGYSEEHSRDHACTEEM